MSTRSIILVKKTENNKTTVHRLYKHHDGYPTDSLNMIQTAIGNCKGNIDDFVSQCESYYRSDMVEETSHDDTLNLDIFGSQGDLEWIYTVDLDAKHIKVFGGGYTGDVPQKAYQNGTVDPLSYSENLYEEYQQEERNNIQSHIDTILNLGFKIN